MILEGHDNKYHNNIVKAIISIVSISVNCNLSTLAVYIYVQAINCDNIVQH